MKKFIGYNVGRADDGSPYFYPVYEVSKLIGHDLYNEFEYGSPVECSEVLVEALDRLMAESKAKDTQ